MKHTWEVSNTGSGTIRIGVNFDTPINAIVICSLAGNGNDPEIQANANVIASAPELLEALENLCYSLSDSEFPQSQIKKAYDKARKVLAKAEGNP